MDSNRLEQEELTLEAISHADAMYEYHFAQYKWAWDRFLRHSDPLDKSDAKRHYLRMSIYEKYRECLTS